MSQISDFSNLDGTNFKIFFILIPFTNSLLTGMSQIIKFVFWMFLDKHILAYFEAGFVKNLGLFDPQIEKHYACKKYVVFILLKFEM